MPLIDVLLQFDEYYTLNKKTSVQGLLKEQHTHTCYNILCDKV